MTRVEFIREYAKRSGLSDKLAELGIIDCGNSIIWVAMPCACGADDCQGWAMLSAERVDHHLTFYAPEELRRAYRKAVV